MIMKIYPAIDIKEGKCVRLRQGRYDDVTVYSDNPIDAAIEWKRLGAGYLHIVDLDGAKAGEGENYTIIIDIVKKIGIPVQLGGGIRSIETVKRLLDAGLRRVILGTAAVKNAELVKRAVDMFDDRIVVGIDARRGAAAVEGWEKNSGVDAVELAKAVENMGVRTIIYTDIERDGMLEGPNLKAMGKIIGNVNIEVIASGGVSSLQDIIDLKNTGASGVIIGKALYTGNIDLKDALEIAESNNADTL
jgi:phosphoribosylformimino-5-aminoimidazole carboxamide ribotide isomerase